jgi:hypothetical protein
MTELLMSVIQVCGFMRRKTWFNPPFSWKIPVPSLEYDSCFLVSHLIMSWVFLTPIYLEKKNGRHYARSVGKLPNNSNNNGTVVQGAFKRENPQKWTKLIMSYY